MAQNGNNYRKNISITNTQKLNSMMKELPRFLTDFFRGIEPSTKTTTRVSYALDLKNFFSWMISQNPLLKGQEMRTITLEEFSQIEPTDIEEYLDYLNSYTTETNQSYSNDNAGRARKLSTLRTTYRYFTTQKRIQSNPADIVNMPRIDKKEIIRLDNDEMIEFINYMHNAGEKMTGRQRTFFLKTKYRDIAIVTLLLGTGIRVSELVGLDVNHVDFKNNGILVTRKGGKEQYVYFGDEVSEALDDYISLDRELTIPYPGHENALFLSIQKKRISVDAVENLVTKYATAISSKHITPHRLRASYGTALYNTSGDIYLTADVLGHESVETTKKHYANIANDRRKAAADIVKLRK